jgi:hypothetical protein
MVDGWGPEDDVGLPHELGHLRSRYDASVIRRDTCEHFRGHSLAMVNTVPPGAVQPCRDWPARAPVIDPTASERTSPRSTRRRRTVTPLLPRQEHCEKPQALARESSRAIQLSNHQEDAVEATAVKDIAEVEAAAEKNDKNVKIFINEVPYRVAKGAMTGAELKTLAAIPAENQLFEDAPGHHDDPQVFDDVPFELKNGMEFYDVPVGNFGAW